VIMSLHESIRYDINATDEIAKAEWETLNGIVPKGAGRTHLGPDHRVFGVTVFHQFHCLLWLQRGLVANTADEHLHHCYNFLRQTILCTGADMLEDGDFMEKDYTRERLGSDLVCHDWSKLYNVLDEKYEDWWEWTLQWN